MAEIYGSEWESRRKKTTAQKHQSTRAYKVRVLLWKHFETWFIIYDIRGIRLFSRMHPLSTLSLSRRWVHTIDWITLNLLCESFRSTASAREEHKQKIYFISLFEIELLFFYEKKTSGFFGKSQKRCAAAVEREFEHWTLTVLSSTYQH